MNPGLHHPRRAFDQFAKLLTEGMSAASLSRVLGVCPGTVSRWLARASKHAAAFGDEHDSIEAPLELQFDEVCSRPATERGSPWIFTGIEVWSRYWVAAHVGRRSRRSTRAFVLRARQSCGKLERPVLITSDPFPYYQREIERTFGAACVYVQVENRYREDCMLRTTPKLVFGPQWQLEALQAQSEDSKRLNTSYVEQRLNLTLRRGCSCLHSRTSGRVRNPQRLAMAVDVIRCSYNFIKPHKSLRFGEVTRTPAMQAAIFDRALSWREVGARPIARAGRGVPGPRSGLGRRPSLDCRSKRSAGATARKGKLTCAVFPASIGARGRGGAGRPARRRAPVPNRRRRRIFRQGTISRETWRLPVSRSFSKHR